MQYNTLIPSFNTVTMREYEKPYVTPDKNGDLILFAIGGSLKDGFSSNFDYYISKDGAIYYIAREGSGCKSGWFGDIHHIKSLMRQGHWSGILTSAGFKTMKGEKIA